MKKLSKFTAFILALIIALLPMGAYAASGQATAIKFKTTAAKLRVGYTVTRAATTTPEGMKVTYTSSNTKLATVDANGKIIGVAPGKVTITAKSGKVSATFNIVIVPNIILAKTGDLSLTVGKTNTRTATTKPVGLKVTYSSSDPAIATVDTAGKVKAIKAGTATITAASGGGSATYTVTVVKAGTAAGGTAPASGATGIFANSGIVVNDKTTAATSCGGTSWPVKTLYFYSSGGKTLGSITGKAYEDIMKKYQVKGSDGSWAAPANGGDWVKWFCAKFNEYRGVSGSTAGNSSSSGGTSGTNSPTSSSFNLSDAAYEVIRLTNEEREAAGLDALEVDSSLMKLAQTRAKELVANYSHTRPDGTTVVVLGYGENVGAKSSASAQVQSWMNSEGHKHNILLEKYNYIGVGCYKDANGRIYWIQIFSK